MITEYLIMGIDDVIFRMKKHNFWVLQGWGKGSNFALGKEAYPAPPKGRELERQ